MSWSGSTAPPSSAPSANSRSCAAAATVWTKSKQWTSAPPSFASPPMLWSMWVHARRERTRAKAGRWVQHVAFFNEAAGAAPVTCVVLKPQACRDFLDVAETHSRRWQRALQYEKEQRHHLEETIEQLAKQHNSLERAWRENPTSHTGEAAALSVSGKTLPSCGRWGSRHRSQ